MLKQAFALPSNLLVQVVNKREYPAFLVARGRLEEALVAAKTLSAHPHPVAQAAGHIEAGFALLAMNRFADGGERIERRAARAEGRRRMARRSR